MNWHSTILLYSDGSFSGRIWGLSPVKRRGRDGLRAVIGSYRGRAQKGRSLNSRIRRDRILTLAGERPKARRNFEAGRLNFTGNWVWENSDLTGIPRDRGGRRCDRIEPITGVEHVYP